MGVARGRRRRRPLLGDFTKIVYKYAEGEGGGARRTHRPRPWQTSSCLCDARRAAGAGEGTRERGEEDLTGEGLWPPTSFEQCLTERKRFRFRGD